MENKYIKELLIQTVIQIIGSILIIAGVVSVAVHLGWLGSLVVMFSLLIAWSSAVLVWHNKRNGY